MDVHPVWKHLLEVIILSGLAGSFAYGLTTWLAPSTVSAVLVAVIVAAITALAVVAPTAILRAATRKGDSRCSASDMYYDMGFSVHKDEGWND